MESVVVQAVTETQPVGVEGWCHIYCWETGIILCNMTPNEERDCGADYANGTCAGCGRPRCPRCGELDALPICPICGEATGDEDD